MIIETNRLFLREYKFDDYDALYEIVSDAETMQHYPELLYSDSKNTNSYAYAKQPNQKYQYGYMIVVLFYQNKK